MDPLDEVIDAKIAVTDDLLDALRQYRGVPKLEMLPGVDTHAERDQWSAELNRLVDLLLEGLPQHPSKTWVMRQFQQSLIAVELEDTEVREHFGLELERLMDILGIESSDGLLNHYLIGL